MGFGNLQSTGKYSYYVTYVNAVAKMVKDAKLKVQATIQGDAVRVSGAKRDDLQSCIALVTKSITDYPIKAGNFRE